MLTVGTKSCCLYALLYFTCYVCGKSLHVFSPQFLWCPSNWPCGCCILILIIRNWIRNQRNIMANISSKIKNRNALTYWTLRAHITEKQSSEQQWTVTLLRLLQRTFQASMTFVAVGWVQHEAHARNWNAEVREIQRFLWNTEKGLNTHKLRVKSCNGSINRCVVTILLAERKMSVPLTLVSDIFYQKQPRMWKFPDGKTVTYVCDIVRANQAPNQALSSQTHSKPCSTNCTQTTSPQTPALGTTLTVQFCISGAPVLKCTTCDLHSS